MLMWWRRRPGCSNAPRSFVMSSGRYSRSQFTGKMWPALQTFAEHVKIRQYQAASRAANEHSAAPASMRFVAYHERSKITTGPDALHRHWRTPVAGLIQTVRSHHRTRPMGSAYFAPT